MTEESKTREQLEQENAALRRKLVRAEKVKHVLMERVEQDVDSSASAYTLFERNIVLQKHVTERTRDLETLNDRLRAQIAEREEAERALKQARDEALLAQADAVRANAAKSEFLANMSHEIRTPMNGIIGMTEIALGTELTDVQRDYLNTALASANSLLGLLNDILDFSKIEAGKLEFESIDFRLRDSLADALRSVSVRAHEKGLELLYRVDTDVPDVLRGDPGRLKQVVLNLVSNAIKFTEQGEVEVRVRTQNVRTDGVVLRFDVRDTGIGIAEDKQAAVFGSFVQADGSTTRRYGGTGLGLAISKRLVDMMNGTIGLTSKPDEGSTFHFTVWFDAPMVELQTPDLVEQEALRGARVLVLDDNDTNLRILGDMLSGWGMVPQLVPTALDALRELNAAHCNHEPFALMITDGCMPGLDGFQMVELVRGNPNHADIPVIMLTSMGLRGDAARCREVGLDGYLNKPVKPSELRRAIQMSLATTLTEHREPKAPACGVITRHSLREHTRSLRVLLAEDQLINQKVAVTLLSRLGCRAEVASNGYEALKALERGAFDLVLMDIQMPELDGFEATRSIRAREEQTGGHLPIIAMTAHAMKGDRERCLAAGLDDYLSKPIDLKDLERVLERWGDAAKPSVQPVGDCAVLPVPGIYLPDALARVGQDRALLLEILGDLARDHSGDVEEIRAFLDAGRREDALRTLHTLKGLLGNVSARCTHRAARDLEETLRAGRDHAELLQELTERFARVLGSISLLQRHELASEEPAAESPAETNDAPPSSRLTLSSVQPMLDEVGTHIQRQDFDTQRRLAALRGVLAGCGVDAQLEALEVAVSRFDFPAATEKYRSLYDAVEAALGANR